MWKTCLMMKEGCSESLLHEMRQAGDQIVPRLARNVGIYLRQKPWLRARVRVRSLSVPPVVKCQQLATHLSSWKNPMSNR